MRLVPPVASALSLAALMVAAPSAHATLAKRLASPPEEFLQGKLAVPDPAAVGVRSHSALLPVHFEAKGTGAPRFATVIPVEASERLSVMLLAPGGGWDVAVQSPVDRAAGKIAASGATRSTGELALGGQAVSGDVYTFEHPASGDWRLTVTGAVRKATAPQAPGTPDGYLLVSTDSPLRLYTHLASYDLVAGKTVGLVAYAFDARADQAAGAPRPLAGAIRQASMRLTTPAGQARTVAMFDDGRHADGHAGDGVWGGLVPHAAAGTWIAQVEASGVTPEGQRFVRTGEHTFPVVTAPLALSREITAEAVGHDLRFDLAVGRLLRRDTVQVGAEVWGTKAGARVPVAWVGGMVDPEERAGATVLPVGLDGRWLERAGATAPFELRRLTLTDRDTHVPFASFGRLAVDTASLPAPRAEKFAGGITDEMLQGPRPSERELARVALADAGGAGAADKVYVGGHKLLLVHGYCSGNVWSTSSFSNAALFQDLNQNRTHDQFARLIQSFGAQFDSFGIVAHSQGGAASLHLYTYYWSGLDAATGSRLIQSVGTPYQGTALAGNLAVLGQIFGVGCGSNYDMTYDGAALWLSGIPSWARAKINYATTSFTDVWYRYDYCQAASDLLLSDPDDGVVEQTAGQLPGALNRGHKTGWCHTSGMRDPAQTTDGTRNADMNANAAR